MFVDTVLLRAGADFSRSAGAIAERGAIDFASAQIGTGIFGDFDAAHGFHSDLSSAHHVFASTMSGHRAELESLAEKANTAATTFHTQDESLAEDLAIAESMFPDH